MKAATISRIRSPEGVHGGVLHHVPDCHQVPHRAAARRGLIAVALIGSMAVGAAAQPTSENSHAPSNADQGYGKPQGEAPVALISVIERDIKRIAKALEAQNADENSREEKNRLQQNLDAQKKMANWAGKMFWVGISESAITLLGIILVGFTLRATKRAALAAEDAVIETRRIGEAQVRAYVDIDKAAVTFRYDFVPGEAFPLIAISAKNSGQSPARDFVWRPTVQYFSGNQRRQRGLGDAWAEAPGASLPANSTFESRVLVTDMGMARFAKTDISPSGDVLIRVRIEFSYMDVFDKTVAGDAYFSGITARVKDVIQQNEWYPVSLERLPIPRDWDDAQHFQNQ